MQRVISAGIIVYRRTRDGIKFLILYHGGGYWNFPKGKLESEERSWQAALREVREETGLKSTEIRLLHGFKKKERFTYKRGKNAIFKVVILFLGETKKRHIMVSSEHDGYAWFTYKEAKKILAKYKDSLHILNEAYDFLRKEGIPGGSADTARENTHVPGGGAPGGSTAGVPGSRQHPQ